MHSPCPDLTVESGALTGIMPAATLFTHRCHDVPHLLKRWKAAARAARLKVETVYESGGHPVLFMHNPAAAGPLVYISAGVHGDEPAPVTALLEWAEDHAALLRRLPVVMFPLFNPAGLELNTRADHRHIDLNRRFHDASHPHIKAWWRATEDLRFRLALCLHEDYDGQGSYCYELNRAPRSALAEDLLRAAKNRIPPDPRSSIDKRAARSGVIRHRRVPDVPGMPEAIALYMHHTDCSLTFETPSEFALTDRIAAHRAVIEACTALID
jgi:protein MpaA